MSECIDCKYYQINIEVLKEQIEVMKNPLNCGTVIKDRSCFKDEYHHCPCDRWTLRGEK